MKGGVTSVEMQPQKTEVTLASPVKIKVTARIPKDHSLSLPAEQREMPDFAVTEVAAGASRIQNEQAIQEFDLTVLPLGLDDVTLPALKWELAAPDGSTATLTSPPVKFKVSAAAAPAMPGPEPQLRAIRPPWSAGAGPNWLVWTGLVLLAALAVWAWRRLRKKSSSRCSALSLDLRPADEIALEKLSELLASGLWEKGQLKPFFNQLADILREYLERRFGIPALRLTTADLLRHLRQAEIDPAACAAIKQIVQECDLVKFAKVLPGDADKDDACESLRELVDKTRLRPVVQEVRPGPGSMKG
ncbi:MAG: hypothetical protein HY611_08715 [Elusimicrobia bacterium]|nr:hypothetical protein [Elusimicrobiota bacterium]